MGILFIILCSLISGGVIVFIFSYKKPGFTAKEFHRLRLLENKPSRNAAEQEELIYLNFKFRNSNKTETDF